MNYNVTVLFLLLLSLFNPVNSESVRASINNRLRRGRNITLHCQSKDDDLGEQNIVDGGEFGWKFSVNAAGTTLFYCDIEWENVDRYHFDAYSFHRDFIRCKTLCSWLISIEGIYALNGETGFWEFLYHWPP